MKHVQILISGFTQQRSDGHGLSRLQQQIIREYSHVHCELFEWDHSISDIAEWIKRYHEGGYLGIAGYSYGGHAAAKVCAKLVGGCDIDHLTLIDAVFGGGSWLWTTRGIAQLFHGSFSIKVPPNVQTYSTYRQHTDWPHGHAVRAYGAQLINEAVVNVPHADMDDLPRAHRDVIINGIRKYFDLPKEERTK